MIVGSFSVSIHRDEKIVIMIALTPKNDSSSFN